MLRKLVHEYQYIHLGLGLVGNLMFVIGSVLFFERFQRWHTVAVWLFVLGSTNMFVGAAGRAAKELYEHESSSG